jgi:hypothetical protein
VAAGDSMLMSVPRAMRAKAMNGNVHVMYLDAELNGCVWVPASLEASTVPVAGSVGDQWANAIMMSDGPSHRRYEGQSSLFLPIPIHFCLARPSCSAK